MDEGVVGIHRLGCVSRAMPANKNGINMGLAATGHEWKIHSEAPAACSFLFCFLYARGLFMADITESAESRQLLENLKGRMLVLKEHL